jgi:hypothetical protein
VCYRSGGREDEKVGNVQGCVIGLRVGEDEKVGNVQGYVIGLEGERVKKWGMCME